MLIAITLCDSARKHVISNLDFNGIIGQSEIPGIAIESVTQSSPNTLDDEKPTKRKLCIPPLQISLLLVLSHSCFAKLLPFFSPPLKAFLGHLPALLPLKSTFSHQPLLPILMLITKGPYVLSTPPLPLQCPLLSSLHARFRNPFFNSTPPNPKDKKV